MAVDMFLKIDGIEGDSTDKKHKGEIELLSFSWGLSNTASSTGGGGGAGKVEVESFSIVAAMSGGSPQLMEKCCTGQHIPSVSLTLATKETKQEYLKIKLSDCLISSYSTGGGGAGGAVPMDQVSFNFSRMDVQAADGRGNLQQVSCDFGNIKKSVDGQHNH